MTRRQRPQVELTNELTHPQRVLYPDIGLTKLGLAQYYVAVADWILPHVANRPLSLVRCPTGYTAGKCFYQKHVRPGTPRNLGRVTIAESGGKADYVYVRDLSSLLSLVQMSILEIHPWGARRDNIERPDRLTFDLDPAPDVPWMRVIEAARAVRELLDSEYSLTSFVKTTGGKGLHVVVPLLPRRYGWGTVKAFCYEVATRLAQTAPQHYTTNMAKAARQGRIFVDYLRNDRGATAVCAYSTRARPGAPVSTPLGWNELSPAIRSDHFNVANLPTRLAALQHDPWDGIAAMRQALP